jgi:hypothetical protein
MILLKKIILLVVFVQLSATVFSQNNSFSQLFYPNITISAKQYSGNSILGNDIKYRLGRNSISGFVPIRSEVQVGIGFRKKLDLKAVHTVLGVNMAQNSPVIDNITANNGYKTAALSIIQMQASIRERLWIYGGGIGFTESDETFFTPQPFLWGGASRMHVLGLHTQIMYGSIIVFNQKFRVVPIFGFNKKIGDNWRVSGILPFQLAANRKFNNWFNLEAAASMKGYSAGYKVTLGAEKIPRKENYQHLNVSLSANLHLLKTFNLSIEGGIAGARQLNTFNASNEKISSVNLAVGPYIGASMRYITTKSKFSSKFLNKTGIGI